MEKQKCKYCDKVIEGHTKNQVNHLMTQHLLSKHSDKVEFREIKQNGK